MQNLISISPLIKSEGTYVFHLSMETPYCLIQSIAIRPLSVHAQVFRCRVLGDIANPNSEIFSTSNHFSHPQVQTLLYPINKAFVNHHNAPHINVEIHNASAIDQAQFEINITYESLIPLTTIRNVLPLKAKASPNNVWTIES